MSHTSLSTYARDRFQVAAETNEANECGLLNKHNIQLENHALGDLTEAPWLNMTVLEG